MKALTGQNRPGTITGIKYDPNRIQKWCSFNELWSNLALFSACPGRAESQATMGMGTFSLVVLIKSKR
jgi:hypothetical protein